MQSHPGSVPYGTPRPCRCIIKLGGSAITVKHQHETLKGEVLASVCSTLKQLYDTLQQRESKPGDCVGLGEGGIRGEGVAGQMVSALPVLLVIVSMACHQWLVDQASLLQSSTTRG